MVEPWIEPNTFGAYVGGILGGGGGTLAGLWGALAGMLAPKGKAKALVLGLGIAIASSGAIIAGIGLYALVVGQPYGIWYPLLLGGGILMIVCGCLVPVVRKRYSEAEARQLAAEQFWGQ
jgi:MFS family permease